MAVPVVMQAALELEPLPGKAQVEARRSHDLGHRPERIVAHPPHHRPIGIRHQDRPVEMIRLHVEQHRVGRIAAAVEHRHRERAEPDVFPQRDALLVRLGGQPVVLVLDEVGRAVRHSVRKQATQDLFLKRYISEFWWKMFSIEVLLNPLRGDKHSNNDIFRKIVRIYLHFNMPVPSSAL